MAIDIIPENQAQPPSHPTLIGRVVSVPPHLGLLRSDRSRHAARMKKFVPALALAVIVAGCAPHYVNLTPATVPRTTDNLYPFEVQWNSPRRGANNSGVRASVMVGTNFFPMTRVGQTSDRWEAHVPLPKDHASIPYRFKFDYDYPGISLREPASDRSPEYQLNIPAK